MSKDKRKIRVIDQNTRLDVSAELIKFAREIRKGVHGPVDACVLIMQRPTEGGTFTKPVYFGKGNFEKAVFMIDVAKAYWLTK